MNRPTLSGLVRCSIAGLHMLLFLVPLFSLSASFLRIFLVDCVRLFAVVYALLVYNMVSCFNYLNGVFQW